jgi:hypothetical protein
VVEDQVDDRRALPVGDLGGIADDGEDAGTDDGADAESREGDGAEGLLEGVLGPLRFSDQLVDRLGAKDLAGQGRCS